MQKDPCLDVRVPTHELPIFWREYREDALRDLFASHFAGLAGQVILDRAAEGEEIVIRRTDGTSVALSGREEAQDFLYKVFGWAAPLDE